MTAVENETDDGTLMAFPSEKDENTDETATDESETAECDCDGLNGFPCWSCVRTHHKELQA